MTKKQFGILIHQLVSIDSKLVTLRDFFLAYSSRGDVAKHKNGEKMFNDMAKERKNKLLRILTEELEEKGDFDVDDLLGRIL